MLHLALKSIFGMKNFEFIRCLINSVIHIQHEKLNFGIYLIEPIFLFGNVGLI